MSSVELGSGPCPKCGGYHAFCDSLGAMRTKDTKTIQEREQAIIQCLLGRPAMPLRRIHQEVRDKMNYQQVVRILRESPLFVAEYRGYYGLASYAKAKVRSGRMVAV